MGIEDPDPQMIAALHSLGLTAGESLVYLHLLDAPRSSAEIRKATGLGARAKEALDSLIRLGLAKRLPGRTTRFAPASPELTLPALVRQREGELEGTKQHVHRIIQRHRRVLGEEEGAQGYVEAVAGIDALRAQYEAIQGGSEEEILGCTKAPLLLTSPATGNPGEERALSRGVSNRWLYEREVLEVQGMFEDARKFWTMGEEIRVVPSLPSKFFVVDGRIALIHVTEETGEGPQIVGLLTRHPELVATLHLLFELLWESGLPLFAPEVPEGMDEPLGARREELVELLGAGIKDISIARQLEVSRRTVARRIQELLESLHVDTRFQAGFRLGQEHERRSIKGRRRRAAEAGEAGRDRAP